ncbi:ParM/StbA family protein [Photobacterium leiognathi]|uniref:ParM/StbA family protein n=1 Tax=Photobacterium leiognathi TaxID=553611 RepID=UPI001EE125B6|nr:ParM/StbA family protein [Photobacterium leiognathi]MCG3884150.1 ParM/StbA family protein [Photobacterium leiognathi]
MSKQTPVLMAIDDGSGNIATRLLKGNGEAYETKTMSCIVDKVLPALDSGISAEAWETNGKQFTVVKTSTDSLNTCSKDYQLSDMNRVLVHNAIATTVGDHPVYLGVTLPTEQFYNRGSDDIINEDRIEAKRQNILKACNNVSGMYPQANIAGVKVYPEAIPAYVYCSVNEDGTANAAYPEEHTTLIVDLGRYTCDLAIISTGYAVTDYMTTDHGVQKLVDKFKVLLQQHSKELELSDISAFSQTYIDQVIDLGYIGSTLDTPNAIAARKDVTALIQQAKEYLNDLVLSDAKALCKNDFSMLTRIVFVGGGANWLNELSQQWFHTVDIPANPEMAVVRGTHKMLVNSQAKIFKELGLEEEQTKVQAETEAE